jgi:hypothetical protein
MQTPLYQRPSISQKEAIQMLLGLGVVSPRELKKLFKSLENARPLPPEQSRLLTLLLFMQTQPPTRSLH